MDRFPGDIILLISNYLEYKDFIEFRATNRRIFNIVDKFLYDKRTTLDNIEVLAILRDDLEFLKFLHSRELLKYPKALKVIQNYLDKNSQYTLSGIMSQLEDEMRLLTYEAFKFTESVSGKTSLRIYEWFKNIGSPLERTVLKNSELFKKFKETPIDSDEISTLLRQQRFGILEALSKRKMIPATAIPKNLSIAEVKILKRYVTVPDDYIDFKSVIVSGDLDDLKWLSENTDLRNDWRFKIQEIIFRKP